jgi:hypothetical protein
LKQAMTSLRRRRGHSISVVPSGSASSIVLA